MKILNRSNFFGLQSRGVISTGCIAWQKQSTAGIQHNLQHCHPFQNSITSKVIIVISNPLPPPPPQQHHHHNKHCSHHNLVGIWYYFRLYRLRRLTCIVCGCLCMRCSAHIIRDIHLEIQPPCKMSSTSNNVAL